MSLSYTDTFINSDDKTPCQVLDLASVSFEKAAEGHKSAQTLVREAKVGELIVTRNKEGKVETSYRTQEGDAIFQNLHDENDVYVPRNQDGTPWKFFELEQRNYKIVGKHQETGGALVVNLETSKLLHKVIDRPTCLKDAWGKGQHQFLYEGSTLKLNNDGRITGIDSEAFDKTWTITKNSL